MYNKLFTKILDSSVWLAPDQTRIVWITFLAMMDEDGMVQLATPANVANRARVSIKNAERAIAALESSEPSTATSDDDGRRIERVPGGWMVLNAARYRDMVRRETIRNQTRERVARFREKQGGNAPVTQVKRSVTPSVADQINSKKKPAGAALATDEAWLGELGADPTYAGINIQIELGKCARWWTENRRRAPSRKGFINWLNKADKPMGIKVGGNVSSIATVHRQGRGC